MCKTCNWWIDQLNTFMYICWVSPGRPSSVQCPGFTKLEHDLDIQFFNPERLHTACMDQRDHKLPGMDNLLHSSTDAQKCRQFLCSWCRRGEIGASGVATWWAGPLPVLQLTSDHHQSMPGYKTKYWKFAEIKCWGFTNFERFGRVLRLQ